MNNLISSFVLNSTSIIVISAAVLLTILINIACIIGLRDRAGKYTGAIYAMLTVFFCCIFILVMLMGNCFLAFAPLIPAGIILTYWIIFSNSNKQKKH